MQFAGTLGRQPRAKASARSQGRGRRPISTVRLGARLTSADPAGHISLAECNNALQSVASSQACAKRANLVAALRVASGWTLAQPSGCSRTGAASRSAAVLGLPTRLAMQSADARRKPTFVSEPLPIFADLCTIDCALRRLHAHMLPPSCNGRPRRRIESPLRANPNLTRALSPGLGAHPTLI